MASSSEDLLRQRNRGKDRRLTVHPGGQRAGVGSPTAAGRGGAGVQDWVLSCLTENQGSEVHQSHTGQESPRQCSLDIQPRCRLFSPKLSCVGCILFTTLPAAPGKLTGGSGSQLNICWMNEFHQWRNTTVMYPQEIGFFFLKKYIFYWRCPRKTRKVVHMETNDDAQVPLPAILGLSFFPCCSSKAHVPFHYFHFSSAHGAHQTKTQTLGMAK